MMTPLDAQTARHIVTEARLRVLALEKENRYLRARKTRAERERQHAIDEARYLHGLLVSVGVHTRRQAA